MKQLFQFRKVALVTAAFTISLAMAAQPQFQKPVAQSKVIEFDNPFDEVEVIGDVTIILTNNQEGKILFQGAQEDLEQAKAVIKKRKLVIHANRKGRSAKFTVYLPASKIGLLQTSGKTEILSSGTIRIRDLAIFLNGSSFVSVRHNGNLSVIPGAGFELIDPQTR